MKKIIIITGYTGSGKTTLVNSIGRKYNYTIFEFKKYGRKYAKKYGRSHIREIYELLGEERFIDEMTSFIEEEINKILMDTDYLIIDGLYIYKIAEKLKSRFDAKIIYLKADIERCYERLMIKNNFRDMNEAIYEFRSKEKTKRALQSEKIFGIADYVIDANKTKEEVFLKTIQKLKLDVNNL